MSDASDLCSVVLRLVVVKSSHCACTMQEGPFVPKAPLHGECIYFVL